MTTLELPSRDALRRALKYDPATGLLHWKSRPQSDFSSGYNAGETSWKTWNTQNAGKVAGGQRPDGYIRVGMFGQRFMAHRIIWLMQTGEVPEEVDHINGNRSDNRWCNLRAVDRTDNLRNACIRRDNTSGATGVSYAKRDGVYIAHITVAKKMKVLGRFANIEDAIEARKKAEREAGFHENHGRHYSDHPKST